MPKETALLYSGKYKENRERERETVFQVHLGQSTGMSCLFCRCSGFGFQDQGGLEKKIQQKTSENGHVFWICRKTVLLFVGPTTRCRPLRCGMRGSQVASGFRLSVVLVRSSVTFPKRERERVGLE